VPVRAIVKVFLFFSDFGKNDLRVSFDSDTEGRNSGKHIIPALGSGQGELTLSELARQLALRKGGWAKGIMFSSECLQKRFVRYYISVHRVESDHED
jgi:hypothetical protein